MADDWAGIYDAGTASVTQGLKAVTFQAAGNIRSALKPGDRFGSHVGSPIRIASIGTNTLTLAYPWPGPSQTAEPYEIALTPYDPGYRQRLNELLSGFTGEGVRYDVQVATLTARAAYNGQASGFAVLVSNIGNGRAAIYSKLSNASGDWSTPAYVTGPAVTLAVTDVREVPYGTPPEVTIEAITGGYNLGFDIPAGMIIQPGEVTTLAPGVAATATFVPITGGFRLNLGIPAGEGFKFIDAYDPSATYAKGDVVSYDGSTFIAKLETQGSPPPTPPTNPSALWGLIALKGTDGTGTGDIVGPASATINNVALFDGPTGKLLKDGFPVSEFMQTVLDDADATSAIETLELNNPARIPDLPASKTTSGTFDAARIPATLTPDKAFRQGNILGVLGQTGGVPTGAIIERGSNANGEYVRFADGTQICTSGSTHVTVNVNVASGNIFVSNQSTWTSPAAFSGDFQVVCGINGNTTHWGVGFPISATQATIAGYAPSSQMGRPLRIVAIGRCF